MHAGERTGPDEPSSFAVEIIRRHHHLRAVEKGNVDGPAVSGGSAGGVGVERVVPLHRRNEDSLLPEDSPAGAVETKQQARWLLGQGRHGEDSILTNDGRSMA